MLPSFGQVFTKNDENFVEAFAIFCGMGIHNTHMYEKAIVAMAKQSVTLEVLSYHASASTDDAVRLMVTFIAVILWWWPASYWRNIFRSPFLCLSAPENTVVSVLSTPRLRIWWPKFGRWWHPQSMSPNVPRLGFGWALPHWLWDALPLAAERQEELPTRNLSQLATCIQRRSDDVRYLDFDAVVESFWGNWVPCSSDWLSVPRFGPSWN